MKRFLTTRKPLPEGEVAFCECKKTEGEKIVKEKGGIEFIRRIYNPFSQVQIVKNLPSFR